MAMLPVFHSTHLKSAYNNHHKNQWVRSIPAMLGRRPERPTKRGGSGEILRGPKTVSPGVVFEGLQALAAPKKVKI